MSNLPLQPLKWHEQEGWFSTKSPLTEYRIATNVDKYKVFYTKRADKFTREATGFATIEDAKTWCWNHYNEKMQPYVKPSPTKVYELAYDCGDSYFTLFMTDDKQQAVAFMESVKDADLDFISSYGLDCATDELLIEHYDDSHPLEPYKNKIFNSIYEDSFSEWAINYGGSSFVSSLDIIEHELLTSKKGE